MPLCAVVSVRPHVGAAHVLRRSIILRQLLERGRVGLGSLPFHEGRQAAQGRLVDRPGRDGADRAVQHAQRLRVPLLHGRHALPQPARAVQAVGQLPQRRGQPFEVGQAAQVGACQPRSDGRQRIPDVARNAHQVGRSTIELGEPLAEPFRALGHALCAFCQEVDAFRQLRGPVGELAHRRGQVGHAVGHLAGIGQVDHRRIRQRRYLRSIHREVAHLRLQREVAVVAGQRRERHRPVLPRAGDGGAFSLHVRAPLAFERKRDLQHETVVEGRVDRGVARRGHPDGQRARRPGKLVGGDRLPVQLIRERDVPRKRRLGGVALVVEHAFFHVHRGDVAGTHQIGLVGEVLHVRIVAMVDKGSRGGHVEAVDHVDGLGRARGGQVCVHDFRLFVQSGSSLRGRGRDRLVRRLLATLLREREGVRDAGRRKRHHQKGNQAGAREAAPFRRRGRTFQVTVHGAHRSPPCAG